VADLVTLARSLAADNAEMLADRVRAVRTACVTGSVSMMAAMYAVRIPVTATPVRSATSDMFRLLPRRSPCGPSDHWACRGLGRHSAEQLDEAARILATLAEVPQRASA
jgi:hypothetical protein